MNFPNEKVAEAKTCQKCQISFDVTDKDLEFYDKVSPVFNGKKFQIPTPKLCPDCRHRRRLTFRNERQFYKRNCDLTMKEMISIYSPDKDLVVYEQDSWWGDDWDPLEYGVDFDFNRSFFEQYGEFTHTIPRINILNWESVNSEYTNQSLNNKNGYFLTSSGFCEDSLYSHWLKFSHNCSDCLQLDKGDNSYECVNGVSVYNSSYIENSENISDSIFLDDCKNTQCSIASTGLRNKKNYFLNEPTTQEEINRIQNRLVDDEEYFEEIRHKYIALKDSGVKKYMFGESNHDVSGDYVYNSKNVTYCFNCDDIEDVSYSFDSLVGKHSHDITEAYIVEQSYEAHGGNEIFKSAFCSNFYTSTSVYYCFFGTNIQNCFGCFGVRNKQYCIFNKQYTKQEYEKLVPKIIEHMRVTGEWGEFFPSELSPFGYNETVANEYFPLEKQEVISQGFNWADYRTTVVKVAKTIPANKLPENITDIPDDILNWAVECEITKKLFRITAQELEFYRKHKLPIPRRHPDQRHLDRMNARNPRKLFERDCDKCGVEMQTTYAPERPEKVYCESCYNEEIY
ncbi:hypothetical protein OAN96_01320 [Candidatus Gracilibacteria bacterium]|nr:hypothetical protein [Candidatus Gracilibacteria bacterium]